MIRVAVCDSNIIDLEAIYRLIEDYADEKADPDVTIRRFQSSYDLTECLSAGIRFNIYVLNLELMERDVSGSNGLIKEILEKDPEAITLFLVNEDVNIKDYEIPSCFVCVNKPVIRENLFKILDSSFAMIDRDSAGTIPVKTKGGYIPLKLHQISYVEYYDHRLLYYLADGTVIRSVSTREPFYMTTRPIMHDTRFIRPHIAFIVNMSHVRSITSRDFIMMSGDAVPISAKRYSDVKNRFLDYLLIEHEKLCAGKEKQD